MHARGILPPSVQSSWPLSTCVARLAVRRYPCLPALAVVHTYFSMPDNRAIANPAPLPDIVQRYLNGESCQAIAAELGLHRATIYRYLLDGQADATHEQLITHGLINRIAEADQDLEDASTSCDIARAREKAKFARMDFERRRPKLYGPKQEVSMDTSLTIIVQRQGETPRDITAEPVQISDERSNIK